MGKLILLTVLLTMNLMLHNVECKRVKRFLTLGSIAEVALDQLIGRVLDGPSDEELLILDRQLEHMETTKEILTLTQQISVATANAPELNALVHSLQLLPKHLNKIDSAFTDYEYYQESKLSSTDFTVQEFSKNSINRYVGPLNDLLELYSIVDPEIIKKRDSHNDYSLLTLMSKYMQGYQKLCGDYKSKQLVIHSVMDTLSIAEIKVFLILEYSYKKLAESKKLNAKIQIDNLKNRLKDRFQRMTTIFQTHMSKASRDVWRCDSPRHIEGETYFKMTVFQKYVVGERDLTGPNDCSLTCGDYNAVTHDKCHNYLSYFKSGALPNWMKRYKTSCKYIPRCTGKLYECENTFNSKDYRHIWTCPAPKNSSRRYEFVDEGDNKKSAIRFGSPSLQEEPNCKEGYLWDYRGSYASSYYSFRMCDICSCTCDDSASPKADQKINLRVATADKDHVVTGIRWLKKDHTLHIQIQQGKAIAAGNVDSKTVKWKDIQEPRDEKDIARLSYTDLRGFLLKDVQLTNHKDNVIAGVKLEVVKNKSKKLLTLRLLPLAYDYENGTLHYTKPFYENPDASVAQGLWDEPPKNISDVEYHIGGTKVPSEAKEPSIPVDGDKYVLLRTSDMKTDAGQNTVPFFNMLDNTIIPAGPLAGIGIYLMNSGDYAGFLALKLLSYDYVPHMVAQIRTR